MPVFDRIRNPKGVEGENVAAPAHAHTHDRTEDFTGRRSSATATYPVDPRDSANPHTLESTPPAVPHHDSGNWVNNEKYEGTGTRFGKMGAAGHFMTYRDGDPYGPRPTFKEWWGMYWHDFAALVFQAMLSLGLLMWSPLPTGKYFAVTVSPTDGDALVPEIYNYGFAFPKMDQHIPIVADTIIALGFPFLIIILMQLRVRSFWDLNNGVWGTIYSVMTACMLQIIVKLVYAGLRPNFLTVCQPKIPTDVMEKVGRGYGHIYFNARICSNPDKKLVAGSMQSFPSGHTAAAFAGLTFAALYINGKLKVFSNVHQPWVFMLAFWFPILAATCAVGTLMLDMSHNWYDLLAGAILGMAVGFTSYRSVYASIWDYRTNHIPLPRVIGRNRGWKNGVYTARPEEVSSFGKMVGFRWGGWGQHEHWL